MLHTYAYHKPSAAGIEKIATMRKAFSDLQELLEETAGPSRERSVAITNLEAAHMWVNKAIVLNDPGSTVDPDATFGIGRQVVTSMPISGKTELGDGGIPITREVSV
jgi:hypothetical protein